MGSCACDGNQTTHGTSKERCGAIMDLIYIIILMGWIELLMVFTIIALYLYIFIEEKRHDKDKDCSKEQAP